MEVKLTTHSIERSLERTGFTGVQLKKLISSSVKPNQFKKKKLYFIWIRGTGIRLTMNKNKVITVWKKVI